MTTIDKILLKVLGLPQEILSKIKPRDLKVLNSLAKIISSPNFVTENQGRLLIKVLSENSKNFGDFSSDVVSALEAPQWSKSFRPVDTTKKLYSQLTPDGSLLLTIEFAFSSAIRKTLSVQNKKISGLIQASPGKLYHADYTEKNIVALVDLLKPLNFEIEEKIQDFYNTIKSWSEIDIKSQFLISNISHANFQKSITADLGIDTPLDDNIIADRSVRYQYYTEKTEKIGENLVEKIAFRKNSKVWIDSKEHTLDDVFSSLLKLKRLPALLIIDPNDHKKCLEDLQKIHQSLEKNGIFENIGIYFRLPNDESGSQFNKMIADNHYNAELNSSTKIVGVQNGKIPKFFLKNDWKPMSVVSIGSGLKQTKTAAYANCCDLIISYTEQQPIIETRTLWE